MELHTIEVTESVRSAGACLWHSTGTLVDVAGDEYVRLPHGTLVKRTNAWKDTRAEAEAAAASLIEAMAATLVRQAKELREAAHAPA